MTGLAPGFLVAAPPLGDPNFDRSVVLLAGHGPEGAFGWIINGRDVMTFSELLQKVELAGPDAPLDAAVRLGGPVAQEQVWLIYSADERLAGIDGQVELGTLRASASKRVLEAIASGVVPSQLMAVLGYAGWGPEQLENEIRVGAWLPTDLVADLVFGADRDQLWQRAFAEVGASPIAFTSRTVGSA